MPEESLDRLRALALKALRTPFTSRTWAELGYLLLSLAATAVGVVVVLLAMASGVALAVTFIGLVVLALAVRAARGFTGLQRSLARWLLADPIAEPEPFAGRPGLLGWLQSALRDRTGWRAVAYLLLKVPLGVAGVYFGLLLWWDALACLLFPFWGGQRGGLAVVGPVNLFFPPGYFDSGSPGFLHGLAVLVVGVLVLIAAPWTVRAFVELDRRLMAALLGPDPVAARLRALEQTRAQSVESADAVLRRIERDLHDGTQAQLVALAMRLGMAKEKLDDPEHLDLAQVRQLVGDAHRGAKEAIVELRDLARGIHPPVLDTGLEGALATLVARSTVPTELTVRLEDRPSPAVESIAYFCVAELMANVAQHAQAGQASVSCVQQGRWLRIAVRDDGVGGAALSRVGSRASGLAGLSDRVAVVDGRLEVTSPPGGPTVVTIDLPLRA